MIKKKAASRIRLRYCMIKVALLECKSGAIAAKTGLLLLLFFAHSPHKLSNSLCINRLSLHAQNSRISRRRFCCALSEEY